MDHDKLIEKIKILEEIVLGNSFSVVGGGLSCKHCNELSSVEKMAGFYNTDNFVTEDHHCSCPIRRLKELG